ncbi:MAG: HAMP domain-containing sensor histidine kinase [Betaproteobacteria bacterium]
MTWLSMLRAFFSVLIFSAMGIACAETIEPHNLPLDHVTYVSAFQLGAAFTLLLWATIRFIHVKKKIYFFSVLTLVFSIARVLVTQPNAFTVDLNLTAAQIYLLLPFLNLGTMVSGLFTIHLATSTEKIQEQRKYLFYLIFASALVIAVLSAFTDRQIITGIAISILVALVVVIFYDFIKTAIKKEDTKPVFMLKLLILLVLAITFTVNLFTFIFSSVHIFHEFKAYNLPFFAFIVSGILIIHMVTILDQDTSAKHSLDATNALKMAADETALRQNQQRFLSMLMHEIRTPLSVIKIGADAITKANHPQEQKNIWTQRIDTAIDNIAQVIDNCVQAEKQESGLIQPSIQKYAIKNETESLYRQYLSANSELETRIKFEIDVQDSTSVTTDINYVRSILLNLISNAYKYSPPFSTILVRLLNVGDGNPKSILFEVENSLGKVEPPDPSQIFQRYYRAESAKKFAGTGLGLWLSQTLAQQIGSRLNMKMTEQKNIVFFFSLEVSS